MRRFVLHPAAWCALLLGAVGVLAVVGYGDVPVAVSLIVAAFFAGTTAWADCDAEGAWEALDAAGLVDDGEQVT